MVRYWHYVGWIVDGLDTFHDGRRETAQRAFGILLFLEGTLYRVGEEESLALEFGEQCGFPRVGGEGDTGGLHELFEISAGAERAIGGIKSGAVEVVFDTRGRRSVKEENTNLKGPQSRRELKPGGSARKMSFVRSRPASLADRQPDLLKRTKEKREDVTGMADNASCTMTPKPFGDPLRKLKGTPVYGAYRANLKFN